MVTFVLTLMAANVPITMLQEAFAQMPQSQRNRMVDQAMSF